MSTKKEKRCCLNCEDQNLALDCMNKDCPCHLQSESIEWEPEFDEKFPASEYVFHHRGVGCFGDAMLRNAVQDFISQAITTAVAEAEKRAFTAGWKACGKEILGLISKH